MWRKFNCQLLNVRRKKGEFSINSDFSAINGGRSRVSCAKWFRAIMLKVLTLLLLLAKSLSANFTCSTGDVIEADRICDGKADCADSSDERSELCLAVICRADQFKCYYGACISRAKFCDREGDCLDGSDEINCGRANGSCE